MRFTKMHGIGNDYIYVDCFSQSVDEPQKLAPRFSDRHRGIGADGLILIEPSDIADVRMRMFNADGSQAEMCGNGVRCLAKYAVEHGLVSPSDPSDDQAADFLCRIDPDARSVRQIQVETGRGVLSILLSMTDNCAGLICVNMGEPILEPAQIPVRLTGQQAVSVPLTLGDESFLITCVSMGNPHVIIYCEDVAAIDLNRLGPLLETHKLFPNRVNVHFVRRVAADEVIMRTWERGSGVTLACGTGAAAVCVAGVLTSKTGFSILAHLPGGDLHLYWSQQDNSVYMAGPAKEVFSGEFPTGVLCS